MQPASPVPGDLVYIVGEFPAASQTFILREIRALLEMGVPIRLFALGRASDRHLAPEDRAWASRVVYVPVVPGLSTLASHLHFLRTRPRAYLRALLALLRLRHRPRYLLFRALYLFLRLPFIARQVERGGGARHVHAHFAVSQTEMALALAALLSCQYSFTAHARDIYATPNALPQKIRGALFAVTCTEYNARYLRACCPEIPPERVVMVRHGVETGALAQLPAAEGAAGPDGPLILAAGRLIAKKGFDVLVDACARLRERGLSFRCCIAGDGPLQADLERRIAQSELGAQVRLLGWQSYEQLARYYRDAALFVLPSRITDSGDRDGLPNVLVEALGFGLPVVSTPVSAIPELILDQDTGLLVPPDQVEALADAMERLLRDPQLGRRLGHSGRERVLREFDLQVNARTLANLFAERTGGA